MNLLQSIILGIIQGTTEFLPISSSAHLVIAPYLLGWHIPAQDAFIFDVVVQLGTLLAVIIYFRKDLYRIIVAVINGFVHKQLFSDPMSRLGRLLVLATIPAVIVGFLFKNQIDKLSEAHSRLPYFCSVQRFYWASRNGLGNALASRKPSPGWML